MTLAANRLRYITILTNVSECDQDDPNRCSQPEALKKCNKTGASLVTLYDRQDADFLINLTKGLNQKLIGLQKFHIFPNNATTWSNGDQFKLNYSNVDIKPGEQICEAIEDGVWKGFNCSDRKPFMCQKGKF